MKKQHRRDKVLWRRKVQKHNTMLKRTGVFAGGKGFSGRFQRRATSGSYGGVYSQHNDW